MKNFMRDNSELEELAVAVQKLTPPKPLIKF